MPESVALISRKISTLPYRQSGEQRSAPGRSWVSLKKKKNSVESQYGKKPCLLGRVKSGRTSSASRKRTASSFKSISQTSQDLSGSRGIAICSPEIKIPKKAQPRSVSRAPTTPWRCASSRFSNLNAIFSKKARKSNPSYGTAERALARTGPARLALVRQGFLIAFIENFSYGHERRGEARSRTDASV